MAGKAGKSGRTIGAKSKYSKELAAALEASGAMSPLDFFVCVVHDERVSVEARLLAARSAAPYVHRRKPQAMEITGQFEFLSPQERELRRSLLVEEIRSRLSKQARTPNEN